MLPVEFARESSGRKITLVICKDAVPVPTLWALMDVHAASDCVYFNDMKYAPYVQSLWNAEKRAIAAHQGKVNEAPGFSVEAGEPMGDILHSFQPQLHWQTSWPGLYNNG